MISRPQSGDNPANRQNRGKQFAPSLDPTRPDKCAPFARALICLKAQDYGSDRIEALPLDAVGAALDERQVAIGPAIAGAVEVKRGERHAVTGTDLGW